MLTKIVPIRDMFVNGSFNIIVWKIVLKTSPMDCKGLSTIRGKDDIWMVLPKTFANRNIKRPICHSDRLYEREAVFDSSRYDLRCNMSPMDWHAEESTAAVQPMTMLALDVDFDSSAMGGISGNVVRGGDVWRSGFD